MTRAVACVCWGLLLLSGELAWSAEEPPVVPDDWGAECGDPVDAGFFFWNGSYVKAPYTVERRGLDIHINDIPVSRGPQPPAAAPSEDPGQPPPGISPFDPFFGEKWRYLSSCCGRTEATRRMLQVYKKCDSFSTAVERDGAIKVTEYATGEEAYIVLSDSWKMALRSREQVLAGRTAKKRYYEQLLRRNRVVSLADGGEHILAGADATAALGILLSKDAPQDKIGNLEQRGILKPGDTVAQRIVTEYREDAQLAERYARLVRAGPLVPLTVAAGSAVRDSNSTMRSQDALCAPVGLITNSDGARDETKLALWAIPAGVGLVLVLLVWWRRRMPARGFLLVVCASTLGGQTLGTETAFSPKSNRIETWEPYAWNLGTQAVDNIIMAIDDSHGSGQGYTLRRRIQDSREDCDLEACTPAAFEQLTVGNGVICVLAHSSGPGNCLSAVSAAPANSRNQKSRALARDTATAWHKTLAVKKGTRVSWRPDLDLWSVDADSKWVATHWAPACRDNRAITVMISCYSGVGKRSLMNAIGGRFRIGWANAPGKYDADMDLLFKRLGGAVSDGSLRVSDDAFQAGGFGDPVVCGSDGPTTLGPAVKFPAAQNVAPTGPSAGYEGTGYIVFDTYCDDTVPAEAALAFAIGGAIRVTNIAWERDEKTGKAFKIRFDYSATPSGNYVVWGRANAEQVLAEGGGGQRLRGDGLASLEGWPASPGDFTWVFTAH